MSNLGNIFPDLVTRLADGREFRTKRSIYDTSAVEKNTGNTDIETDLDNADNKLEYLNAVGGGAYDDAYTPYLQSSDDYSPDTGLGGYDEALLLDTVGSDGFRLMKMLKDNTDSAEYDKSLETLFNSADTQGKMDNLQKAMDFYNIIKLR